MRKKVVESFSLACNILMKIHGRPKVHEYFLLLPCKSSIWFAEKHIFKIVIYFFNTSRWTANYVISFEVYDGVIKTYSKRNVHFLVPFFH